VSMTPYELAQALGGAQKSGPHWRARCPAHDDHNASLDIREGTKVPFVFTCRAGCMNEVIIAELKARGLWGGSADARATTGPAPVREIASQTDDTWKCITPVPDGVPPLPNSNPSMRFTYRDAEGRVLGYTERIEKTGGGKDVKPFSWCVSKTGAKQWKRKGLPPPHPLYGLDRLAKHPDLPVLVTEGEKKADSGERLLKSYVTVSWAGGSGRVRQADWTPLKGRKVIIWPDHDESGLKAALEVQEILKELTPDQTATILKIPVKFPRAWDLWDAEQQGWKTEHVLGFIEYGSVPPDSMEDAAPDAADPDNRYFVVLGHDHNVFYLRSVVDPQVNPHTPSQLANQGYLNALAPLTYWESRYMEKTGVNWARARDDVIWRCKSKGIYNPADVRGRGAWLEDDGRLVFHTGKKLFVDGEEKSINEFQSSRYSYEAARDLGLNLSHPLADTESFKILTLCRSLRWRKEVSGDLLAGWIVLAPFSGALQWRPHIWLTGTAGAGKTTVVNEIIKPLVAIAVGAEGATTEAGLRGELRGAALPVLFDEVERSGNNSAARIEAVIELMMSASSSEGRILKGTAHQNVIGSQIRSCFCLASINTALDRQGIARRVTPLEMLKGDAVQWPKVQALVNNLPRGEALIARTMRNFKALRANIKSFRRAIAEHFNDQPMGDQFGPLLAAACSLVSGQEVTLEQATIFVEKRNWEEHKLTAEDKDENQAISRLLAHVIRMARAEGPTDRTIGELIQIVAGREDPEHVNPHEADRQLRRIGVAVSQDGGHVYIAHKNGELEKVFKGTQWEKNWRDSFERVPGAQRNLDGVFASGRPQKCIAIPLPSLFGSEAVA
jgi:putative DNA primase/helicase